MRRTREKENLREETSVHVTPTLSSRDPSHRVDNINPLPSWSHPLSFDFFPFFSFLSHSRWIARHRKPQHGTRQSFTWRTSPTLRWKSTGGPRPRIGRWSELLFLAPLPRWTVDMKWFGVGLEERQGKWRPAHSSHFWCPECHAPTKSGWGRHESHSRVLVNSHALSPTSKMLIIIQQKQMRAKSSDRVLCLSGWDLMNTLSVVLSSLKFSLKVKWVHCSSLRKEWQAISAIKYSWTPLCRTRLSRTPRYLELFLAPFGSNQLRLSRTLLRSEETLVNIGQEVQSRQLLTICTEIWGTYWRVHGNESKVRLTGLASAK